ncbi:type II toxin-antitoxin system PemK/MazF family toxin [Halorubrum ezzemoulense]|uniref:type II toxin-antitoxin system PemK/MazF family toxin n=1 Tax=Halorubrum ezzemoulense TaxID=337243 RepID=UPI0034E0B2D0
MTYYYPQGSLVFAADPTGAHSNPRPVIVISDADRPYVEQEATVVCLTTQAEYSYEVTRLPDGILEGVELRKTSYVMPWAIYTIPLSSIRDNLPSGTLTDEGIQLIADVIDQMVRP